MDFLGKTLGNYRIDELLGKGSLGDVYQAYDLAMQRDVAIKVIHPQFARHPEFRERFPREASAAAKLNHPGIAKVLDFGQYKDQLYVVTECIPGPNLRLLLDELIRQREWLSINDTSRMIKKLCQTIEYAHEYGAFGWDLNPTNMLIKPEPASVLPFQLVLTDLRLANLVEPPENGQEKFSLDSPAYMSPEQVLGKPTDARSDIYSLGILLYEFVVGILPFPIKTLSEAILYHAKESVPEPRSIRPDLPDEVERVILKALEKEPENRYANATELAIALMAALSDITEIVELEGAQDGNLFKKYEQSLGAPVRTESTNLGNEYEVGKTELQSVFDTAPEEIPPTNPISIQVVLAGRPPQTFTFPGGMVTIGREKGNDLVLEDSKISRRHAQITLEGSNYYVADLGSANGTYLDNVRVQPGAPAIWRHHQELRMGGASLRLTSEVHGGTIVESYNVGPRSTMSRLASEPLVVTVTPQQLSVEAGGGVTATLSILNQNPNAEYFSISLTGIPNDWVGSLPSHVQVVAGEQEVIAFTLTIPRSPQSRAGRHAIALRVTDQNDPGQFVELRMTLTIAAYSQFKAELEPVRLQPHQVGRVTIANVGNYQETFTVQFTDPNGRLAFQPPYIQMRIPEARSVYMEFRTQEKQVRVIGGEQSYPFNAHVTAPSGETQTLQSELISRGFIPTWVLPVILLLCLFLAGSAAVIWRFYFHTPTPNPGITAFIFTSPAASGMINEDTHTIAVTVPFGTNVTSLAPTITHTGVSISPESGVPQNFTSPVTYTITAADGSTQIYTVTVTVASQTAKEITAFSFTVPLASGVINEGTHTIAVTVPAGTDLTSLNPAITHTGASINPNSGAPQNFTSPVTYTVTAADGTTQIYMVTVTRSASTNTNLSNLVFSTGTLNPAFASGTTIYTQSVPNAISSLTITPTAVDPTATIKVNGVPLASGSVSSSIPLNVGDNTITITVTAQDGTTTQTYTVKVTRAGSGIANISNLVFSTGTLNPPFASGTTTYTQSVPNATANLTITPIAADPSATIKVNGVPITSGSTSSSIPLNIGDNTITITVTAQDGATTQTYSVKVNRAGSGNANLNNLVFSTGTLNPAFTPGITTYSQSVPYSTANITVTPITADAGATIKVKETPIASGSSTSISLNVGDNPITITVTAQDGTTRTYTVTVIRATPSANANLSNLFFSTGALTPAFASGITSYTQSVLNASANLIITPIAADQAATITVNTTPVNSGTQTSIHLNLGENTIIIAVTAEDGTTKQNYIVTVTMAAPSTNANLSSLEFSTGKLNSPFASGTTTYTLFVPNTTTSLTVTPTAADTTATIKVNNNPVDSASTSAIPLNVGDTTITITVTAQDGITTQPYTVTVKHET